VIWILFMATVGLSLGAAARVKAVYNRDNPLPVRAGRTGAEVAAAILRRNGVFQVQKNSP
jgi:Zn-dependent membrane protease YugP